MGIKGQKPTNYTSKIADVAQKDPNSNGGYAGGRSRSHGDIKDREHAGGSRQSSCRGRSQICGGGRMQTVDVYVIVFPLQQIK